MRFIKGLEGTVGGVQGMNLVMILFLTVFIIGMELELLYPLMLSIHKPYSHVMLQYPSLEQQQLINKLQKVKIVRL